MAKQGKPKILKPKGMSLKGSGKPMGRSHTADHGMFKQPRLLDRGPGSAISNSRLREDAARLKAERKLPGSLGYHQSVDSSYHASHDVKSRRGKSKLQESKVSKARKKSE